MPTHSTSQKSTCALLSVSYTLPFSPRRLPSRLHIWPTFLAPLFPRPHLLSHLSLWFLPLCISSHPLLLFGLTATPTSSPLSCHAWPRVIIPKFVSRFLPSSCTSDFTNLPRALFCTHWLLHASNLQECPFINPTPFPSISNVTYVNLSSRILISYEVGCFFKFPHVLCFPHHFPLSSLYSEWPLYLSLHLPVL